MLKQIAWNTFKNTGDINTFMELMEVDKTIDSIENALNLQKNNDVDLQNIQTKRNDTSAKITL